MSRSLPLSLSRDPISSKKIFVNSSSSAGQSFPLISRRALAINYVTKDPRLVLLNAINASDFVGRVFEDPGDLARILWILRFLHANRGGASFRGLYHHVAIIKRFCDSADASGILQNEEECEHTEERGMSQRGRETLLRCRRG